MSSRHPQLNLGIVSSSLVSPKLFEATRAAIHATRLEGDTLKGLRLARIAVAMAESENNPPSFLEAANLLAICQTANASYIESVATCIDAFNVAKKLRDRLGMAHALTTLASAATFVFETLDVSLQLLDECFKLAKALDNVALEARVRTVRGMLLGNLGRFDESEADFKRALQLSPFAGENTPRAMVVVNHSYLSLKRAGAAPEATRADMWPYVEKQFNAALEVARADKNPMAESHVHASLGELNVRMGNYAAAMAEYHQVMRLVIPAKQGGRIAKTYFEMAGINVLQGKSEEALADYEAALNAAQSYRPSRLIGRILVAKAALQRSLGCTERADLLEQQADEEAEDFLRQSEHARHALNEFWEGLPAALGSAHQESAKEFTKELTKESTQSQPRP